MNNSVRYDFQFNGIFYNILDENSVEVTYGGGKYNKYSGFIPIPASVSYNGQTYSVTTIGYSAFAGCENLIGVTIPKSVTTIGTSAFRGCGSLVSIDLPNSIIKIGSNAFEFCESLIKVVIPNSVEIIDNGAFRACYNLTSVTIPNSVKTIGYGVFRECESLKEAVYNSHTFAYLPSNYSGEYTIPDGIHTIASAAFYQCNRLTNVILHNDITMIGANAFYGCESLTEPVYNTHVFAYLPRNYSGAYIIPNGIKLIAGNAFESCQHLTEITIPNSVTIIGERAFEGCYRLTDINIPDSVTAIESWAFKNCTSLTTVTLPDSVNTIGNGPFVGCKSIIQSVYNAHIFAYSPYSYDSAYTVPTGIKTLVGAAFDDCKNLTSVTIPNSVTTVVGGMVFNSSLTEPVYNAHVFVRLPRNYSGTYSIPDGIKTIADSAFQNCEHLTSITIPETVTTIGNGVFHYARPNSITCLALQPPVGGFTEYTLLNNYILNYISDSITLYVPQQSIKAYAFTPGWRQFKNIQPIPSFNCSFKTILYIIGAILLLIWIFSW